MAYNSGNLIAKATRVHEIYEDKKRLGLSKKQIYWGYIYLDFHISKRTFSKYLNMIERKKIDLLKQKQA